MPLHPPAMLCRWAAGADSGVNEWRRTIGAWHVAFGVLAALTCVLLMADRRYAALGALLVLAALYAAVGARALSREPTRAGQWYVLGAVPLTVVLFALDPTGSIMLFVLYPHVWALLRCGGRSRRRWSRSSRRAR